MSTFKKTKVVMLPTNEKAVIGFLTQKGKERGHLVHFDRPMPNILDSENQHLYFLSDEEIKEGDWFIMNSCIVRQCSLHKGDILDTIGGLHHESVCKKIIATTDKSLSEQIMYYPNGAIIGGIESYKLLPQPSQSFIEKFVEEYNKGNVISEVSVEYKECCGRCIDGVDECIGDRLKINPKDNTIAIRKVNLKGEHIINFVNDFIKEFPEQNLEYLKLRAESWIEENL